MSLYPHVRPLMAPVRPVVICRHLGQLSLMLAALVAVPTLFAGASSDWQLGMHLLLGALLPALVLGACARMPAGNRALRANEALVVTVLVFVLAAALMTFPVTAGGLGLLDAWFEAVSGVTTTGLTLVSDPASKSDAFLFTRGWMQWFGGLGIVVLLLWLIGRLTPADALSQAFSAQTGTGFSTLEIAALEPQAKLVLIVSATWI
ncbi:MAG: potassium transporter TrkG [Pseudomonadota bacterium]|nr:potassium transporter TrkG [Pseudomonadota bacterium]